MKNYCYFLVFLFVFTSCLKEREAKAYKIFFHEKLQGKWKLQSLYVDTIIYKKDTKKIILDTFKPQNAYFNFVNDTLLCNEKDGETGFGLFNINLYSFYDNDIDGSFNYFSISHSSIKFDFIFSDNYQTLILKRNYLQYINDTTNKYYVELNKKYLLIKI